jgi:hypothetical protein
MSSTVEEGVNWLCPPSRRSNDTSDPESTVRTGLSELSHLRWMWEAWTWKEPGILRGVE